MSCLTVRSMIYDFCPNYDMIVNYVDNDILTKDIINEYRDFLTTNNDEIEIHLVDFVVGEYLSDEKFYIFVHDNFCEHEDMFTILLDEIIILHSTFVHLRYINLVVVFANPLKKRFH